MGHWVLAAGASQPYQEDPPGASVPTTPCLLRMLTTSPAQDRMMLQLMACKKALKPCLPPPHALAPCFPPSKVCARAHSPAGGAHYVAHSGLRGAGQGLGCPPIVPACRCLSDQQKHQQGAEDAARGGHCAIAVMCHVSVALVGRSTGRVREVSNDGRCAFDWRRSCFCSPHGGCPDGWPAAAAAGPLPGNITTTWHVALIGQCGTVYRPASTANRLGMPPYESHQRLRNLPT